MIPITKFSQSEKIIEIENLNNFIKKNKNNFIISDNNWDDSIWDITNFLKTKKINRVKNQKIFFRSVNDNSLNKNKIDIAISAPLIEFVKAVICELTKTKALLDHRRIIYAIQSLEFALIEQKRYICITKIDIETLNQAENYLRSKYKDPWSIAKKLQYIINNIIIEKQLNTKIFSWSTSINYTQPTRSDSTKKNHIDGSLSKVPHLEEILALADIYNSSNHIPDKIVTCFVALAMFAPSRGSEILTLPTDCIVTAYQGNQEIMGIKWRPLKGGDPLTKFAVNKEYEELAYDAVNYLIELGKPARKAAHWYNKNPKKLYLPLDLENLRNQPITLWEVAQILGKENTIKGYYASRYGLSKPLGRTTNKKRMFNKAGTWVALYDFKELENFILSQLPKTFPILDGRSNQHWHESLFVLPKHILTPQIDSLLNVPISIDINQINKQLGSNPVGRTIFSRNNKQFENGRRMYITSHQFRHLLNTLAQTKALSQELIAFWSGRKSIKQNDVYNNLSQEAIIEAFTHIGSQVKAINQTGNLEAKVMTIAKINDISYDEALKIELGAIHITQYGICRHDYSLTPCPKDKDCGNCGEFSVMKGNKSHQKEANYQVQILEKALLNAKDAEQDGHTGAKRWIEVNEPKLGRWQKIKAFLENDSIPNNTMFTLADSSDYHQTKVGLAFAVRALKQK